MFKGLRLDCRLRRLRRSAIVPQTPPPALGSSCSWLSALVGTCGRENFRTSPHSQLSTIWNSVTERSRGSNNRTQSPCVWHVYHRRAFPSKNVVILLWPLCHKLNERYDESGRGFYPLTRNQMRTSSFAAFYRRKDSWPIQQNTKKKRRPNTGAWSF